MGYANLDVKNGHVGSIPITRSIFVEISAFTDKLSKTAVYLKLA